MLDCNGNPFDVIVQSYDNSPDIDIWIVFNDEVRFLLSQTKNPKLGELKDIAIWEIVNEMREEKNEYTFTTPFSNPKEIINEMKDKGAGETQLNSSEAVDLINEMIKDICETYSKIKSENLLIDEDNSNMREIYEATKKEVKELGGWEAFKQGDWFIKILQKTFKNYFINSNTDYYKKKYNTDDKEFIYKKLVAVACGNATILGGVVGLVVSTDEIVGFITAGEGGIGIPANVAVALVAIATETLLLTKIQISLVANIAKLYEADLDPDDPEDALTVFAFALGGAASETLGKFGIKLGGDATKIVIKKTIKKEVLATIKKIGKLIGRKILQRSIIKYAVPGVSVVIGGGWNYVSTRIISKKAKKHFSNKYKK
jgi:uncharacterized protein (DUF697 family)